MTTEEGLFFRELEEATRELGRLASAPWSAAGNGAADRDSGPEHRTGDRPSADAVSHPSHYTEANGVAWLDDPGIECIEITRYMTFTLGNAVKYLWRAGSKGSAAEDLRKAIQYIEFALEDLDGGE